MIQGGIIIVHEFWHGKGSMNSREKDIGLCPVRFFNRILMTQRTLIKNGVYLEANIKILLH